ncbi:hypothetical protein WDW89_23890 [Deltaproteobacteria bacterium TL4]
MKYQKSVVIAWMFVFLVMGFPEISLAAKNFSVAPGIIEINLSRASTQTFLLTNTGDETIRLLIRPVYFEIDSKSLAAGSHLNPQVASVENIEKFILVSPRVLSLAPGQNRSIRISVRPEGQLSPGDYRSHLLVQTLEEQKKKSESTKGLQGMSIQLEIKLETGIAIYGRVGEPKYRFEWACEQVQPGEFMVNVINLSQWRYSGWMGVFDEAQPMSPMAVQRLISLRESKRTFQFKVPTEPLPQSLQIRWGQTQSVFNDGESKCPLVTNTTQKN